jgi:hypothetical protein
MSVSVRLALVPEHNQWWEGVCCKNIAHFDAFNGVNRFETSLNLD